MDIKFTPEESANALKLFDSFKVFVDEHTIVALN